MTQGTRVVRIQNMLTMQLAQIAACLALCLALGALGGFIIAMHGRVAGVSKDLAAILRMQEQIVATEKQHADELQQLQETMRTCCAKQDEVSDRLHQIKTVLEHFDRDLVALQRNPVDSRTHFAHRRALHEVAEQVQEGERASSSNLAVAKSAGAFFCRCMLATV